MRPLTVVFPFFCNPGMLAEQAAVWRAYPDDLLAQLHIIVVDDCSPDGERAAAVDVPGLGSLRIFRLLEKKRWNWLACRNLGARVATTDWLLLTDIDHVVPAETVRRLVDGDLDARSAYRFRRVTATGAWPYDVAALPDYKPHNDSWLLTRSLFFDERVGGYDERLSGCYGTSGEFRDRVLAAAWSHVLLPEVLVRYPREVIADASTLPSVYTRKNDPENDAELARRKAKRDRVHNWRPVHGLVPWEQVA